MKLYALSLSWLVAALLCSSSVYANANDETAKNEIRKDLLRYVVNMGNKVFGPRTFTSDPANERINEATIEEAFDNRRKRPPVRQSYNIKHQAFFQPSEELPGTHEIVLDKTTGIPLANGRPDTVRKNFRKNMLKLIEKRGRGAFMGSNFVFAGYNFLDEGKVKKQYERMLTKLLGVPPVEYAQADKPIYQQWFSSQKTEQRPVRINYTVQVLSIPRDKLDGFTRRSAKILTERFLDLFPRTKKDYVPPTKGEVVTGLMNGAMQQPFMIAYTFNKYPTLEAWSMITVHCALVALYKTYAKTLRHYVQRPGNSHAFSFGKQLLLSMPYFINANVSANITEILNYISAHGPAAATAKFGVEAVRFATTLSIWTGNVMQSLYYFIVNTAIVGTWENKQSAATSREARTFTKVVTLPFSMMNTVALYMAADMKGTPLPMVGEYVGMNYGHGFLMAMALAAVYVFGDGFGMYGQQKDSYGRNERRNMLDVMFTRYHKAAAILGRASARTKEYLKPTLDRLHLHPVTEFKKWLINHDQKLVPHLDVHKCLVSGL